MTHRQEFHLKPLEEFKLSPGGVLFPSAHPRLVVCWPHPMIPNPAPWVECYSSDGTHVFNLSKEQVQLLLQALEPEVAEPCCGGM